MYLTTASTTKLRDPDEQTDTTGGSGANDKPNAGYGGFVGGVKWTLPLDLGYLCCNICTPFITGVVPLLNVLLMGNMIFMTT